MEYPKCSFGTKCFDEARKKARESCIGRRRTEKEVQEDVHRSEREVARMLIQARLGVQLQRKHFLGILGANQSETKHIVSKGKSKGKKIACGNTWSDQFDNFEVSNTKELQREKKPSITLTGLKIFPKVGEQGGKTIAGNLEVHANGFYYAASSPNFCVSFLCTNVKQAFFRVEDEKMSPLLHFQFHDPIEVGTEKRWNIQFRLMQTLVGQKRAYHDSDKIEKEKRIEALKNFVHNVEEKWRYVPAFRCCPFADAELRKKNEFQGNLPFKAPTVFCLTFFALVGLVDEPFVVVKLYEIEFVNLRLKRQEDKPMEIDMTIVFQDFKRDVVQINSIPIEKLDLIKDRCSFANVKYYENECNVNWCSLVKQIASTPGGFVPFFNDIEKPETLKYYNEGHSVYCGPNGEAYCGPDGEGHTVYCGSGGKCEEGIRRRIERSNEMVNVKKDAHWRTGRSNELGKLETKALEGRV